MTFTTFCVLAAIILAIAIQTNPVVEFIFVNPGFMIARVTFAHWYMLVTSPVIMNTHMRLLPVESIIFYSDLIDEYFEIFPEAANMIEDDYEDID